VNRVVPAADLDREATAFTEVSAPARRSPVRYTKLAVNKLVEDALNVAFDASTALALVTFSRARTIRKRWRRCARSACPSSRIAERRRPP
jgi:hypothetical protein